MSEQEKLVEAVAKAIADAENGLDGDPIGVMLHENDRVCVRDNDKGFRDLDIVLRSAARAAIAVTVEACARVAGPKFPRPCDCTECYCGKLEDAEAVARWDGAAASAAAVRALAPTSPPAEEE